MSSPACAWPDRASPKWPVTVPFTGAPIRQLVHPPAAGGVAGAGDAGGAGFVAGAAPEPLDPDPLAPDEPDDDPEDDPPADLAEPPEPAPWATRPLPSGEAALEPV